MHAGRSALTPNLPLASGITPSVDGNPRTFIRAWPAGRIMAYKVLPSSGYARLRILLAQRPSPSSAIAACTAETDGDDEQGISVSAKRPSRASIRTAPSRSQSPSPQRSAISRSGASVRSPLRLDGRSSRRYPRNDARVVVNHARHRSEPRYAEGRRPRAERRHAQRRFVVANEEGDQFGRFPVARIGRDLVDAVGRLVEALARLVNSFRRATLHLKADCPLGDISDYSAGMAVRLVCFSGRVADFNHGRAQVPAIQLRQGMGKRGWRTRSEPDWAEEKRAPIPG